MNKLSGLGKAVEELAPTLASACKGIADETAICSRLLVAEAKGLDTAIMKKWFIWLPLASAFVLLIWRGHPLFIASLLLTQPVLYASVLRSGKRDRLPDIAKTQALFWSLFMALQCVHDSFIRIFDSF